MQARHTENRLLQFKYTHFFSIDGNHKLIRWRLVIHGAIDGYSRLVLFLHCSDNNRASTVLQQFVGAVQVYGLPSRIRTDQGLENVEIARMMLEQRGTDRASVLVGLSVHNQRIKRLWRDVFTAVAQLYHRLFYHLENLGILDPLDCHHLYALHYVYILRINHALTLFLNGWNKHPVSGCGGNSPMQMFTKEMVKLSQTNLPALDFFESVPELYGMEDEDFVPESDCHVSIPPLDIDLDNETLEVLQREVDPLLESSCHGVDLYQHALQIVQE